MFEKENAKGMAPARRAAETNGAEEPAWQPIEGK